MNVRLIGAVAALVLAGSASASPGDFLLQIGTPGADPGQLDAPWGTAVGADGSVYVTDTANNRVQVFSRTGTYLRSWGSFGTANGQFDGPTGIAVCGPEVFVADTNNDRIQLFDTAGNLIDVFPGVSAPHGLACDSLYLYVVETGLHRIQIWEWDDYGFGPPSVPNGGYGSGPDQYNAPTAIALGPNGKIYIADTGNDRVLAVGVGHFGSTGSGDGQFDGPVGIAVDAGGNVYVADRGNGRIQVFTATGTFESAFGVPGSEAGQLASPSGVALDAGPRRLVVADAGNDRLQVFESMSADLAVTSFVVPATIDATQTFNAEVTVRNLGQGSSGSFHIVTRLNPGNYAFVCNNPTVPSLAPGAESTRTLSCTFPSNNYPGAYSMTVTVTTQSGITDPNTANNTATAPLQVNGPDLVVSSVSGPASAATLQGITVSATVVNQGLGSALPSTLHFYLAQSTTGYYAHYLGGAAIGALAPGGQQTVTPTFTVPAGMVQLAYYVRAHADGSNVLRESDENNNKAHSPGTVFVSGPDLVITGASLPPVLRQGETATVNLTVRNQGTGSYAGGIGASVVLTRDGGACYPVQNCDESDDDWWLGGGQLGSPIPPGGEATIPVSVAIPADFPPVSWNLIGMVDSTSNVVEPNEGNNFSFLGTQNVEPSSTTVFVAIDIKPGSYPNSINLGSSGNVPVAILSSAGFDATTVDPLTVTLESSPIVLRGNGTPSASTQDVNADGLMDLVVQVATEALQLTSTSTVAVLQGRTYAGVAITGSDEVNVVP